MRSTIDPEELDQGKVGELSPYTSMPPLDFRVFEPGPEPLPRLPPMEPDQLEKLRDLLRKYRPDE